VLSVCASAQTHALLGPQSDVFNAKNTQMLGARGYKVKPPNPLSTHPLVLYLAAFLSGAHPCRLFWRLPLSVFTRDISISEEAAARTHTRPQCQSAREKTISRAQYFIVHK